MDKQRFWYMVRRVILILTFLLILPVSVSATPSGCESLKGLQINPSEIGIGDSFTLTLEATVTPSLSPATMQATLKTLPTGLELISGDWAQQDLNLGVTTTKTYSWTIRGKVSGSYTLSVELRCSDSTGALSNTYTDGVKVIEGIILKIDITEPGKSITVSKGNTYTVRIWLYKSGEETAQNVKASLNLPAGFSFASGYSKTQNVTELTGGQTFEWKFVAGGSASSGTMTILATSDSPPATKSEIISWTCTDCAPAAPEERVVLVGVGPPPKIVVKVQRGKANITIPSIAAGKMANISIERVEDLAIRTLQILVVNSVNNVKVFIQKLPRRPAEVEVEVVGKVYHYIKIDHENIYDADIEKVKLSFAVAKNWISDNNINADTIKLSRWTDKWEELPTTKVSETADEIIYEAESPGLSVFAIAGEEFVEEEVPCVENWSCTEWSECIEGKQTRTCTDLNDCGTFVHKPAEMRDCEVEKLLISPYYWIIVLGAAVLLLAYWKRERLADFVRVAKLS